MKVAGVILAGGQASRMGGGDKCLLDIDGKTVLDHVMSRIKPQAEPLVISANGAPDRFAHTGLPVVADDQSGFLGPLAGILAAMGWATDRGASHIVSVAADTPFFPADLVEKLCTSVRDEKTEIAIACSADDDGRVSRQPTFGLWPVGLANDLRGFLANGDRKILLWAQRHRLAMPIVGPTTAFFNINTPEDLLTARGMVRVAS